MYCIATWATAQRSLISYIKYFIDIHISGNYWQHNTFSTVTDLHTYKILRVEFRKIEISTLERVMKKV